MSVMQPSDRDSIQVGKPMPFSVYGSDRKLLLAKGLPVVSERMRQVLLSQAQYIAGDDDDSGAAELPGAHEPPPAPAEQSLSEPSRNIWDDTPPTPPVQGPLASLCRSYANYEERSRFGMRIARDERSESYPAFVMGVVKDKRYLILSAPVNKENVLIKMVKDEVWLCRLFNATTVFRFAGKVLKVAFEPVPYVHVELPKTVERRMVRKQPRALASLAATLYSAGGEPAVIVDISVSGVRLAVDAGYPLQKDTVVPLHINVSMLDQLYQLTIPARITATFGVGDDHFPNVHFYGAQFEDLSEHATLVLHGYVQEQLAKELDRLSRVLAIEDAYVASGEEWLNRR